LVWICPEEASSHPNVDQKVRREPPVYTALFVDDMRQLVELFPPRYPRVFAHHSTIAFEPGSLEGIEIGKQSMIEIVGRVTDTKADVLLVQNPKSRIAHPHITLACAEGVEGTVEYFSAPVRIQVTEGCFDGEKDIVRSKGIL